MTATDIITEAVEDGRSGAEILSRLREGVEGKEMAASVALEALRVGLENVLQGSVNMFGQAMHVVGIEVDVPKMTNAYLEALDISMAAFVYDAINPEVVEGEVEEDAT